VTQPVLALFGEHSPFLATADYLAEHLPHCENVRVPGAKHRAPEENPEGFVELVSGFLRAARPSGLVARSAS
jgi:pimeloyl-ACP methyl ester carboxylesterase